MKDKEIRENLLKKDGYGEDYDRQIFATYSEGMTDALYHVFMVVRDIGSFDPCDLSHKQAREWLLDAIDNYYVEVEDFVVKNPTYLEDE